MRPWAGLERRFVVLMGRRLGIQWVVRWLRNPNPPVVADVLRAFGASVGEGTTFKGTVRLDNVWEDADSTGDLSHLVIGVGCYVGDDVFFDLAGFVSVGDGAVISARSSFVTHQDCNRSPWLLERFPRETGQVRIADGAWVGFDACVLMNVTVGIEAVVAARSLVRTDVPPRTLVAGVPAVVLRPIAV